MPEQEACGYLGAKERPQAPIPLDQPPEATQFLADAWNIAWGPRRLVCLCSSLDSLSHAVRLVFQTQPRSANGPAAALPEGKARPRHGEDWV
jgi:hypothetical protein